MAYFAELHNNIVQRVIVAESKAWCEEYLGGTWVETFTDKQDKNYAGAGYEYRVDKGNFVAPKPFDSFILDEKLQWKAPKETPSDLTGLAWSELQQDFRPIREIIQEKNG